MGVNGTPYAGAALLGRESTGAAVGPADGLADVEEPGVADGVAEGAGVGSSGVSVGCGSAVAATP